MALPDYAVDGAADSRNVVGARSKLGGTASGSARYPINRHPELPLIERPLMNWGTAPS